MRRTGQLIKADEVFDAWTSRDLKRMLAARSVQTNPIDRHFLLQGIVKETYRLRSDTEMRRICIDTGLIHLAEFARMVPALRESMGVLPRVSSFALLATAMAEVGKVDEAIWVCEEATRIGADDGTKSGYRGRAERLRVRKRRASHGA